MAPKNRKRPTALGLALKKARGARSQAEVAREAEVSQVTISSWERGELLPRHARIDDIATAYRLRPERVRALWLSEVAGS